MIKELNNLYWKTGSDGFYQCITVVLGFCVTRLVQWKKRYTQIGIEGEQAAAKKIRETWLIVHGDSTVHRIMAWGLVIPNQSRKEARLSGIEMHKMLGWFYVPVFIIVHSSIFPQRWIISHKYAVFLNSGDCSALKRQKTFSNEADRMINGDNHGSVVFTALVQLKAILYLRETTPTVRRPYWILGEMAVPWNAGMLSFSQGFFLTAEHRSVGLAKPAAEWSKNWHRRDLIRPMWWRVACTSWLLLKWDYHSVRFESITDGCSK